jgi:hypothetical protein
MTTAECLINYISVGIPTDAAQPTEMDLFKKKNNNNNKNLEHPLSWSKLQPQKDL